MNFNGKKINFLKNNVNYLSKPKVKNNFSKYPCPDQAVAHLIFKNKIWIIDNKNNNISKRESNLKLCRQLDIDYSASISGNYILVILESPHFYEFNFQGNPLGPAIGKTGKNFQTNFSNIVNKNQRFKKILNKKLKYQIVFMNAVQYQASEGRKPLNKAVRDFNWIYFWATTGINSFSQDLIKRIQIFPQKSIIINLCTFGDHNLQNFVTSKLNNYKRAFFIGYHPCNWWKSCRRVIK